MWLITCKNMTIVLGKYQQFFKGVKIKLLKTFIYIYIYINIYLLWNQLSHNS